MATSDLYPHISIRGNIFFDANNFKDLFEGRSVAGSVGPSFQWNILNYGRLVNAIRVQDARFQQLVVQYQNTVFQANAEAENSIVGFLKTQQQVKELIEAPRRATNSRTWSERLYDEGRGRLQSGVRRAAILDSAAGLAGPVAGERGHRT